MTLQFDNFSPSGTTYAGYGGGKVGALVAGRGGVLAGDLQEVAMGFEACHEKTRHAGLPCAQQFAFAAQFQVFFCNAEAILRLAHDGNAGFRDLTKRILVDQKTC